MNFYAKFEAMTNISWWNSSKADFGLAGFP
jgi:hypothetical protein